MSSATRNAVEVNPASGSRGWTGFIGDMNTPHEAMVLIESDGYRCAISFTVGIEDGNERAHSFIRILTRRQVRALMAEITKAVDAASVFILHRHDRGVDGYLTVMHKGQVDWLGERFRQALKSPASMITTDWRDGDERGHGREVL